MEIPVRFQASAYRAICRYSAREVLPHPHCLIVWTKVICAKGCFWRCGCSIPPKGPLLGRKTQTDTPCAGQSFSSPRLSELHQIAYSFFEWLSQIPTWNKNAPSAWRHQMSKWWAGKCYFLPLTVFHSSVGRQWWRFFFFNFEERQRTAGTTSSISNPVVLSKFGNKVLQNRNLALTRSSIL